MAEPAADLHDVQAWRTVVPYFSLLGYMVPSIIFVFPLFLVMVQFDHVGLHALHPDRDRGGWADRRVTVQVRAETIVNVDGSVGVRLDARRVHLFDSSSGAPLRF